jgi:hypothetical protein
VQTLSVIRDERGNKGKGYKHGLLRIETNSTCHEKIGCREGLEEMVRQLCRGNALLCIFGGAREEHVEDGDREGDKPCKEYNEKDADAADDPSDDDNELADRFEDS